MAIDTYSSEDIALVQLETALRLYAEGDDFFSVITLAGAAEEVLGKVVSRKGKENSLDALKKAASAVHTYLYGEKVKYSVYVYRANYFRNKIKHVNPGIEPLITFDVKEEAGDMLTRAIDNYWLANETITVSMQEFERNRRES